MPRKKRSQRAHKADKGSSLKNFLKRRKLGDEEDEWCDALSDLNVCNSSSDDEYFDAETDPTETSAETEPIEIPNRFSFFLAKLGFREERKRKNADIKGPPRERSMERQTLSVGLQERERARNRESQKKWQSSYNPQRSSHPSDSSEPYRFGSHSSHAHSETSLPVPQSLHGRHSSMSAVPGTHVQRAPQPGRSSSSPNVMEIDFDDILRKVAAEFVRDNEVTTLGCKLGYNTSDIEKYKAFNRREDVDFTGTLKMLRDWRKLHTKSTEYDALRTALIRAGNTCLADNLLPIKQIVPGTHVQRAPQPGRSSSSPNVLEIDFDDILRKVAAEFVRDNEVTTLGYKLGYNTSDIEKYKAFNRREDVDFTGTLKMLRDWRKQHTKSTEYDALRTALIRAGNTCLADNLLPIKQTAPETRLTPDEQPSRSGISSRGPERDFGDILNTLADQIVKETDISKLGKALGFSVFQIRQYIGSNHWTGGVTSWGTVNMLQDWRKRQLESTEYEGLKTALRKAEFRNLADRLLPYEPPGRQISPEKKVHPTRKVTVTLMTSSELFTVGGLKKRLEKLKKSQPDLIEKVKVLQLPYSRIQFYTFPEPVDVMILCHSIENRRFAITNVTDSLYDEFLNYSNRKLGKDRIVVIAHDFPPEEEVVREVKRDSFRHTQWSTFEKAGLVMISGMMDKEPEIRHEDWASLVKFLEEASKSTPVKAETSPSPSGQKHTHDVSASKFGMVKTRSRKPVIYICTSWGHQGVKGLKKYLQTLLNRSYPECEIREQELPYSRLQDFKFPSGVDKNDAMILCHSVQNRGFSITDVENSIYDEYLKNCYQVFGKDHTAVIVHDFEYSPEILKIHIETFRRGQPTTFELADFVALAARLDDPNVKLCHDGSSLERFVKRLR